MPLIKETLIGLYRFILNFLWQLRKAIEFQVRDWDIVLAQRYVLWKRLLIWSAVVIVVGGIVLGIAMLLGQALLRSLDSLGPEQIYAEPTPPFNQTRY